MSNRIHLDIRHEVRGEATEIFAGFTQELFEVLSPAFPPAKLLKYDGNQVGDEVIIQLGVWPFIQRWKSVITAHEVSSQACLFVDEGRQLPFPLNYWVHRHRVEQKAPGLVEIIEDITFGTPAKWLSQAMKPLIAKQFKDRGPRYSRYFNP